MYDKKNFTERAKEIVNWLSKEYSVVRTGRATPALLDTIQVESYGARVPLNQVGSVGIEDPRTLRVNAWDKGSISQIESAIRDADLGVSVVVDDAGLRVIFPELTSERREQLLKIAKMKLEEARVSLRGARDEAVKEIDAAQKAGELSEDGKFNAKEELQKLVDTHNAELGKMYELKETEITE